MGAGRTELMEAIAGRDPISGGRILLGGTDLGTTSIKERIALGLGLVPEDRQRDGLVQMMSVGANMSLASLLSTVKNALHPAPGRAGEGRQGDRRRPGQDLRARTR